MTRHNQIKLLVTGFGPFPGVHSNPSGKLVEWIERGQVRIPKDVDISTEMVPTSWDRVQEFTDNRLAASDANIALHFGVSARARGFKIERIARNTACTTPDCDGRIFHGSCLASDAPSTMRATLAADPLVRKLRLRGLDARGSSDAGRYLCNMLLFLSLKQAQDCGRTSIRSFVHIPPLKRGSFEKADLLNGFRIIMAHCVQLTRRADAHKTRSAG